MTSSNQGSESQPTPPPVPPAIPPKEGSSGPPPIPTGEAWPSKGSLLGRIKKQRRYVAIVVFSVAVAASLLFIVSSGTDSGGAVEVTHQWKFQRERFYTSVTLILEWTNRSDRTLWLLPSNDDPLSSKTLAEAKKETEQLRLLYSEQAVDQLKKDMKDIYWLQVAIKKGERWIPSQYFRWQTDSAGAGSVELLGAESLVQTLAEMRRGAAVAPGGTLRLRIPVHPYFDSGVGDPGAGPPDAVRLHVGDALGRDQLPEKILPVPPSDGGEPAEETPKGKPVSATNEDVQPQPTSCTTLEELAHKERAEWVQQKPLEEHNTFWRDCFTVIIPTGDSANAEMNSWQVAAENLRKFQNYYEQVLPGSEPPRCEAQGPIGLIRWDELVSYRRENETSRSSGLVIAIRRNEEWRKAAGILGDWRLKPSDLYDPSDEAHREIKRFFEQVNRAHVEENIELVRSTHHPSYRTIAADGADPTSVLVSDREALLRLLEDHWRKTNVQEHQQEIHQIKRMGPLALALTSKPGQQRGSEALHVFCRTSDGWVCGLVVAGDWSDLLTVK